MIFRITFLVLALMGQSAFAQYELTDELNVDEHLNATVPLDMGFVNEEGKRVLLKDLVDKPTVLNLVYYRCASICGPLIAGLASVIDKMELEIGRDYRVVTISFNDQETPELAREKKANFLKTMKRSIDPTQWNFLTGAAPEIRAVADSVGFHFKKVGSDFVHPGVVMVLTKEGKISRYLYGTSFLPMDMTLAVMEASSGQSGPSFKRALLYCFTYDPNGRTYVFRLLPILGGLTLLLISLFVVFLYVTRKKRLEPK